MDKTHILIVEDEGIVAITTKLMLNEMGHEVTGITDNYSDTLSLLTKNEPDLILMDIVIKGDMDGIDTAEEIKKIYDIPIVFVTAYGDKKTMERIKAVQSLGCLHKPFNESAIRKIIDSIKN